VEPRRSHLDGERQSIQARAYLVDRRGGLLHLEAGSNETCASLEQAKGIPLGKRWDRPASFSSHPDRSSAGGQDRQLAALLEQRLRRGRASRGDVFAVVQDQQRLLCSKP